MNKYYFKCERCGRETGILPSHYKWLRELPREERDCRNCGGQLERKEKDNPLRGEKTVEVEMPKSVYDFVNVIMQEEFGFDLEEVHTNKL